MGKKDMVTLWTDPYEFNNLLFARGLAVKVYAAMEQDDVSYLAITAYKILQDIGLMPTFKKELKSAEESTNCRNLGNVGFNIGDLDDTLIAYNRALKYAPKNSEEMTLVLNNRSALSHKLKCFEACIKDIDNCLAMKCPTRIIAKLKSRKEDCSQNLWQDLLMNKTYELVDDYFRFSVKRHPEITCASNDIDVVIEAGLPKIVAAKDISVGTVIAIETPFITNLANINYETSCYYCHKLSLNLMPCDGCVVALFCSDECKQKCMKEYHNIECKVMEVIQNFAGELDVHLAFKAALKIKSKCSWKQFIKETKKIGVDRMKEAPIREIFDSENVFSMLSYDNSNSNLVHGTLYNFSFQCAVLLKALNDLNYFPHPSEEKLDAMQAFAKVVMNLRVMFPKIFLGQTAKSIISETVGLMPYINMYLLAFSGRLKHSCKANVLLLPLLNKVAVATQRPIKKGDEITVSYLQHFYHIAYNKPKAKDLTMYRMTHSTCRCQVCEEKWSVLNLKICKMTPERRKSYLKWRKDQNDFKTTCRLSETFDDMMNTKEHYEIYKQFIVLLNFNQQASTRNVVPKRLRPDSTPCINGLIGSKLGL